MPRVAPPRRGISIKAATYDRLKWYCEQTGRAMSNWLEEVVKDDLDAKGVPVPTHVDPPRHQATPAREPAEGNFTF